MTWKPRMSSAKGPDWWAKADTIAKFLSSVVIAIIGLLITSSIQRTQIATTKAIADAQMSTSQAIAAAQIEAARVKAADDKRLQEGQLSVQLLNHLISKDDAQRQIAVIALRRAVPAETYDQVVAVLAQNDPSVQVRVTAINQLAASPRPQVSSTLTSIALNQDRTAGEREAAGRAAGRVSFSMGSGAVKYIFGASQLAETVFEMDELQGGVFTYFLLRGLGGSADASEDGTVSVGELRSYLAREVSMYARKLSKRQTPFDYTVGPEEATVLSSQRPSYAVVVGISKYQDDSMSSLRYAESDARKFAKLLANKGVKVTELYDAGATRANILKAVNELVRSAPENADVIFYYAGHSRVDPNHGTAWAAYDVEVSSNLSFVNIADVTGRLDSANVQARFLFVDAAFAASSTIAGYDVSMSSAR
jgi:hypothetical protein